MAKQEKEKKKGTLSIHSENIFPIIKKWLYSEHDIFLRELISNSVDAMQKRVAIESDIDKKQMKVEVKIDKKNNTIKIVDYGIGMDIEEVEKYINQIAFSGAEDFVEKYKDKQSELIGHFGLGFYSAFMVAEKVTIDTLSCKEKAEPVYWECDGKREFTIAKGERKKVGTTVTVHVNEDNEQFLNAQKIKDLIEKYSNFVPFPVYVNKEKEPANIQEALWNRKPSEVEDKEYKEFYKKLFDQYEDPLFWIHLNVDFPFKLKGILYFPKIKNNFDINQGRVKLYCNNVFVADDLKQIIPEFLLLLRGGLDIPDIPLNVSRSFLQEDKQVKTISKYIIKKVAGSLKKKFENDRKEYEKLWEDINHFVKYGIVSEDKFYDAIQDYIIFKTPKGEYLTVEEYKAKNPSEDKMHKIYYAKSEDTQLSYLELMEEEGIDVIVQSSIIDSHLFQKIEMKEGDVQFIRVDSEVNENLVNQETDKVVDKDNKTVSDKIKDIVEKALDDDKLTIETKNLKSKSIPGMVVFNEQIRRMQEMNNFAMMQDMDILANHTFVVNVENETVKKLVELKEAGKDEEINLLCNYMHDLALLEQKQFTGKELQEFIKESNRVLKYIK